MSMRFISFNHMLSMLIFFICALLGGCSILDTSEFSQTEFGSQDKQAAKNIYRINNIIALRKSKSFHKLAELLEQDLLSFNGNDFAKSRISAELAEIYSHQLLDIEKSIDFDNSALQLINHDSDTVGNFSPNEKIARQQIISNSQYVSDYINVSNSDLKAKVLKRLDSNKKLVSGNKPNTDSKYEILFLRDLLEVIATDIKSTHAGTIERHKILSRLIRAEYELSRIDASYKMTSLTLFNTDELKPSLVDLTEIDFLRLADYFTVAFQQSGDIRFAEYALDTVYLPYVNLRNPSYRWRYNKLINEYISTLIDANYQRGQYDEMLYYTSLNKSRMLLEERLVFSGNQGATAKIADLSTQDDMIRTNVGLPDKTWFKQRLATTNAYLDFYVGGKYVTQNAARIKATKDSSSMPLTTRDFGVEDSDGQVDSFVDNALYISQVSNGRVTLVKKLIGSQLGDIKSQLDSAYQKISNLRQGGTAQPIPFMRNLQQEGKLPANLTVSPDKWMAKHPLDLHLDTAITRSVNFFTTGASDKLGKVQVAGFFNPTLDLPGAEQEAVAIQNSFPNAQVFKREAAQLNALQSSTSENIVHLSMHGAFNATDPKNSKLFFSGAQRGLVTNDIHALYARDMGRYAALRERDLIFAAACQTGLSAADEANENELMGILRPLTANRNKNIILSLWKVDDAATKDFVAGFYQHLASTKNITESFHFAQDIVRAKYKLPYYWAAFYLSQSR